MKIGIFDSGLGGIIIAKAIIKKLPQYDYIYLGDTKNLPYGDKTPTQIYNCTKKSIDYLFKQNCQLIIIACNTSSALALRKIQQKYLLFKYPERRVLGVVIPTLEYTNKLKKYKKIGVVGTVATIKSHIYKKELTKIDPAAEIFEIATAGLVPLIEANSLQKAEKTLELYLGSLKKKGIEALILGCTHYPILKNASRKNLGKKVAVISQDEIIPGKLEAYLKKHPETAKKLSKNNSIIFQVTKLNKSFEAVAERLFGKKIKLRIVKI